MLFSFSTLSKDAILLSSDFHYFCWEISCQTCTFESNVFYSKASLRFLFVLVFNNLTTMCLHVVLFVLSYLEFSELCELKFPQFKKQQFWPSSLDICFCPFSLSSPKTTIMFHPLSSVPFFFPPLCDVLWVFFN